MNLPDIQESDLTVWRITQQEAPTLTRFCVTCSAFFEMTQGRPGSEEIATEILELLPPGKTATNKHLLGFSRDDSLVAVADLGDDYPNARDWYVALLLVTPSARHAGLGSRVWTEIESWIRERGGRDIRLIVQQQNPQARRFWEAHGFAVVDESIQRFPGRENRIWSMLKSEETGSLVIDRLGS